jgi:hypothetical protein
MMLSLHLSLILDQPQRADDLWLLGLAFIFDQAQAVLTPQRHDQLGQVFIADAGAQLAVQRVRGRLAQRVAVDVVNRLEQLRIVEERTLDPLCIPLEPREGAKPRTPVE